MAEQRLRRPKRKSKRFQNGFAHSRGIRGTAADSRTAPVLTKVSCFDRMTYTEVIGSLGPNPSPACNPALTPSPFMAVTGTVAGVIDLMRPMNLNANESLFMF